MKLLNAPFLIIMLLLTQSSYSQNSKVSLSSFSDEKIKEIHNFVDEAFTTCNDPPKLTSKNASPNFRNRFENIELPFYCNKQLEYYGEITNIELVEVVNKNDYNIFRYKIKRSEADWLSEIRVFLDEKDRITSVSTKYFWADTYYGASEYPKFTLIDISLVKDSIVKQNDEFALKSYNICEASEIFIVNETNGIYRVIRNGWTNDMLKECASIKESHGNFKDLKFTEFLTDSLSLKIYRYKVNFDKLKKPSEIRIYSKLNDKYSGIFVIDVWYDQFFDLKKAKEKSRNELGN